MNLLTREQRWACPNCTATDVTYEAEPHVRMHTCPGLKGLTAPMIQAGVRCKVEVREWQDYVGDEVVTYDGEGTPVSAVETTREDGNDIAVFAPTAMP